MGIKDAVTKNYMEDLEVFADAFNFLLYGGRQLIKPERLKRIDTASLAIPCGKGGPAEDRADERKEGPAKKNVKKKLPAAAVQRYRDNIKSWVMMEDDDTAYLILGIEGQSEQHFAMPVRNMLYDALQYAQQVKETAKKHRREKKSAGSGEFLSGFCGDDRLTPVVTLVILFNTKPWQGPTNLHDMFPVKYEGILRYVPDYHINLMAPAAMSEEEINLLSSSLREVILFLRYAADEERMAGLMKEEERFRRLDREAANVINVLTNCGLEIDEEEEVVDMCIAWEKMKENARRDGLNDGKRQGFNDGKRQGFNDGKRQGFNDGKRQGLENGLEIAIRSMMTRMELTMEKAMDVLEIPESERSYYAEKLTS